MRSPCSRAALSNWWRCAVSAASAVVRSEKTFSAAASVAAASATRASAPLRRPALSRASARIVSSSAASRASAASASAARRFSRSTSAANWTRRTSSSAMRSLARASSRSRSCWATLSRCKRRAGAGLGLAQFRHRGGGQRLALGGFGLRGGAVGDLAHAQILGALGLGHLGVGGAPAQMEQHRLGLAHLRRDRAVADRLLGLLLEPVDLRGELPDHVFEPQQIGFRALEPQFRLMAAGVQAGDAGGFFQHAAALLGLGLDDLADTALMHQRRRTGAGRGIGEHDLHVAGAHLAAVDAVAGTGLALDAAGDFQGLLVVELRRRRARGIVDGNRHLGVVARRAACWSRRRSPRPSRRRASTCARIRPSPSAALRPGSTCRSRSARRRRSGPARSENRSARRKT